MRSFLSLLFILLLVNVSALSDTLYFLCNNKNIGYVLHLYDDTATFGDFKYEDCKIIDNENEILILKKDQSFGCVGYGVHKLNTVNANSRHVMNDGGNENLLIYYGIAHNVSEGNIIIFNKKTLKLAYLNSNSFEINKMQCMQSEKMIN